MPSTLEFWAELVERALAVGIAGGSGVYVEIGDGERVEAGSLLSLPGYGAVQHTYEDMLAAHEALAASAGDRVTVPHKDAPGPVTYIGLDRPEGLPRDAAAFTLANLAGLIPA